MAIENTYLLGKNITLGCGFDLQAKAPLDSRQTVPAFEGLRALIIGDAAYEGMIVYDEGTKKTYQAQKCESYSVEVDGKTKTYDIAFREFGINESELKELIASETTAAMEFKGATATLPENPAKGDMWKVTASFEVAGETTKVGDSIVYNGEEWFRIPSGDDIEDTWRIVKVEGTSLGGVADGKELNLTAGNKLDVVIDAETGAVVYKHEEIAAPTATPVGEDEQTRTYIASIETDGYGHITGYKTATENVEDTNTTYEFEGLPVGEDEAAPSSVYFQVKSSEEEAAEVIYLDTYNKNEANDNFVAKETGKSLVSDDEIARLANVDNYDDEEVRGLIDAIDNHSHENKTVLDGITAEKVADWDDAVSKEHTHTFVDSDVEDAIAKKHSHTFTDADVEDAISKEHTHNFSDEAALNGITAAKVADWDDAVSKEHTHSFADSDVEDAIAKKHEHAFVEAELNKIADGDVEKWNIAYAHSQVAHAPADAQANVIESVKVNGTALEITNKAVDITIPESTKVEASETNGNIKVDGEEVTVYTHPESHTASEISDLDDTIKGYDYATKAEAQGYADAKDEAINNKLDANGWSTDEEGNLQLLDSNGSIHISLSGDDTTTLNTEYLEFVKTNFTDYDDVTLESVKYGPTQISTKVGDKTSIYKFPAQSGTFAVTSDIDAAVSTKANSADVYAKTETYNKTEIEALLTWGSF